MTKCWSFHNLQRNKAYFLTQNLSVKELCLTRSFEIRRSPGIRIFWDLEGPREQEIARSGGTQGSGSFEIRRGPGTAVTIDKKRSLWSWMTIHQETEGDWEADDAEESSTVFKRIYKSQKPKYQWQRSLRGNNVSGLDKNHKKHFV